MPYINTIIHQAIKRLVVRHREVSNPRDVGFDLHDRIEIWRRIRSNAADTPAKFNSDPIILTTNFMTSTLAKNILLINYPWLRILMQIPDKGNYEIS